MIERMGYWIMRRKKSCRHCCLWCRHYSVCRSEVVGMREEKSDMRKSKARKRLDICIDTCLECEGIQTKERNCHNCQTFYDMIEIVREIREERTDRRRKGPCTEI